MLTPKDSEIINKKEYRVISYPQSRTPTIEKSFGDDNFIINESTIIFKTTRELFSQNLTIHYLGITGTEGITITGRGTTITGEIINRNIKDKISSHGINSSQIPIEVEEETKKFKQEKWLVVKIEKIEKLETTKLYEKTPEIANWGMAGMDTTKNLKSVAEQIENCNMLVISTTENNKTISEIICQTNNWVVIEDQVIYCPLPSKLKHFKLKQITIATIDTEEDYVVVSGIGEIEKEQIKIVPNKVIKISPRIRLIKAKSESGEMVAVRKAG